MTKISLPPESGPLKWSDDEVAVLLTAAVAPAHTDQFFKALARWSHVIGQEHTERARRAAQPSISSISIGRQRHAINHRSAPHSMLSGRRAHRMAESDYLSGGNGSGFVEGGAASELGASGFVSHAAAPRPTMTATKTRIAIVV